MTTETNECREAFEADAKIYNLKRDANGDYEAVLTRVGWEFYQAAWNRRPAATAEVGTLTDEDIYAIEFECNIGCEFDILDFARAIERALNQRMAGNSDQLAKDAELYAVYHTEEYVGSFFQGVFSSEVFAQHWIDHKSPYPANECFIRPVQPDVPLCAALSATTKHEEV